MATVQCGQIIARQLNTFSDPSQEVEAVEGGG